MALAVGTRLGPYEVVAPIGSGGMGEVYKARDTRLDRTVAIKVLPEHVAQDPALRQRFEREAKTLAALSHPHICPVFDVGEAELAEPRPLVPHPRIQFLVMEYLEGETLAERLTKGRLPLDQALKYAIEITDALDKAHRRGIIHRDLKPGNIMLTKSGSKLLDFGLAKLSAGRAARGGTENLTALPTASSPITGSGTILGTLQYMAPEQLEGQEADARTDIFAFGALLYEMITGKRAFEGKSQASLIAAILERDPPLISSLQPMTPRALDRVVRKCLAKEPDERWHAAKDLCDELKWIAETNGDAGHATAPGASRPGNLWYRTVAVGPAALVALVITGAVAFAVWNLKPASSSDLGGILSGPVTQTSIDLPPSAPLALGSHIPALGFDSPVVALSPDGTRLAYVGQSANGTMLYLYSMAGAEVTPLAGTEGAIHPFFSPDGQRIGFLTNDKVKKLSVQGGPVTTLADARIPVRAWWSQGDVIHFSENAGTKLSRVRADGTERPSAVADFGTPQPWMTFSDVLPDGRSALVTRGHSGISFDYGEIVLVSTETQETTSLIRSGYGARYVPPGYLVFGRSGSLLAVRFDGRRKEVQGEPVPLVADTSMDSLFGQVHAAISHNGLLAYVPGGDRAIGKLAWVDRNRGVEFLDAPPRIYGVVDLAADGKRLAVHVADVTDYIEIYDTQRREGRRLPSTASNGWPVWNPDGLTIAFTLLENPPFKVFVRRVDEDDGSKEILANTYATSWSPDGNTLAFGAQNPISFASLDGQTQLTDLEGWGPSFSPDGRWFAYISTEGAQYDIWVVSYPDTKVRRQVSPDGGMEPVWCACGELFYRKGNRWFSTRISTKPELRWDPPRVVFETDFIDTPGISYDVSPDGQRLLVVKRANPDTQTKLHVVHNWYAALEGQVPRN